MIVEVENTKEFMKWMDDLDKERYRLIFTRQGEGILRPKVSTRNLDTIYVKGLDIDKFDILLKNWSNSFPCKKIYWDESKAFRDKERGDIIG